MRWEARHDPPNRFRGFLDGFVRDPLPATSINPTVHRVNLRPERDIHYHAISGDFGLRKHRSRLTHHFRRLPAVPGGDMGEHQPAYDGVPRRLGFL